MSHPSRHLARAREVFRLEIDALRSVRAQLDDSFDAAVELLVQSLRNRGKIVVCGIGKSGAVGRKMAATLTSTGSPSVVLDPVDALHGDLGVIADGDVILALSYSGESDELLRACLKIAIGPAARDFGAGRGGETRASP